MAVAVDVRKNRITALADVDEQIVADRVKIRVANLSIAVDIAYGNHPTIFEVRPFRSVAGKRAGRFDPSAAQLVAADIGDGIRAVAIKIEQDPVRADAADDRPFGDECFRVVSEPRRRVTCDVEARDNKVGGIDIHRFVELHVYGVEPTPGQRRQLSCESLGGEAVARVTRRCSHRWRPTRSVEVDVRHLRRCRVPNGVQPGVDGRVVAVEDVEIDVAGNARNRPRRGMLPDFPAVGWPRRDVAGAASLRVLAVVSSDPKAGLGRILIDVRQVALAGVEQGPDASSRLHAIAERVDPGGQGRARKRQSVAFDIDDRRQKAGSDDRRGLADKPIRFRDGRVAKIGSAIVVGARIDARRLAARRILREPRIEKSDAFGCLHEGEENARVGDGHPVDASLPVGHVDPANARGANRKR